jgi:hypothetical protein
MLLECIHVWIIVHTCLEYIHVVRVHTCLHVQRLQYMLEYIHVREHTC